MLDAWLFWAAFLAPFAAGLLAALLWYGSDSWWPATVLLFGPRWIFAVLIVGLMAGAAWRRRILLLPLLFALLTVLGPVMGFRVGALRSQADDVETVRDLTLVTYNVRGGRTLRLGVDRLMSEWGADIAAFQECGDLRFEIQEMEGWHTRGRSRACLVSRFPILETRVMEREDLEDAGGSGLAVGYLLDGERGPFWVTNVHLDTPREGLELVRSGRIFDAVEIIERQTLLREEELTRAKRFASETEGPRIVMGDFNTPVESTVYRRVWGDWTNAFSEAGLGVGTTRRDGWAWARIDHVVVDSGWTVISAELGADMGSDHLPMITRIRPT